MSEEKEHSSWQSYPPWIVFDPDTKAEWVTPETLRYYVANVNDEWFICDRFPDAVVEGTKATSRAEAIRRFYTLSNRPMPEGWPIPHPVNGTKWSGP